MHSAQKYAFFFFFFFFKVFGMYLNELLESGVWVWVFISVFLWVVFARGA